MPESTPAVDARIITGVSITNSEATTDPVQTPQFCGFGSIYVPATTNSTLTLYGLLDGDPDTDTFVPIHDQAGAAITVAGIAAIGIYTLPSMAPYRWLKFVGNSGTVADCVVYFRK